jgi:hypothetical protein
MPKAGVAIPVIVAERSEVFHENTYNEDIAYGY